MPSRPTSLCAFLVCLCLSIAASAQSAPAFTGLAAERARLLRHGINASMWFAQAEDYSPARLRSYTTEDDIALMHAMGFDHVRLSIDADELLRNAPPDGLNASFVAELDRVVSMMLLHHLRVIVDVHPREGFKQKLRGQQESATRFVAMWSALAAHFAGSDPERVFFEILNEPEFSDAAQWATLQVRAVLAIRKAAPHHTLLATAPNYSGLPDLLTLRPLADDNILYTFHDYEPFAFTHQGASWTMAKMRPLRGVPYPSTPEAVAPVLRLESALVDQYWLEGYGLNRWDGARIRTELNFAAQWGALHHVPVYCGEFGVYKKFADPAMRAAWIRDTRIALEQAGIGWAMWDYQGSFAAVERRNGRNVADPAIAAALGLHAQPRDE